jgi:hypothetical protein
MDLPKKIIRVRANLLYLIGEKWWVVVLFVLHSEKATTTFSEFPRLHAHLNRQTEKMQRQPEKSAQLAKKRCAINERMANKYEQIRLSSTTSPILFSL